MGAIHYIIGVTPVGKPRMTQSDRWKERPAVMRYRAYADALRASCETLDVALPEHGASLAFHLPMPKSWSQKKRTAMAGTPHYPKPDLDNLLKAFMDALLPEDSRIWHLSGLEKRWTSNDTGYITLSITPLSMEQQQ